MSDFLTRRGRNWHFVRRVPAEFAQLDRRVIVQHSTRIKIADDRLGRRAARIAMTLNQELELGLISTADLAGFDRAISIEPNNHQAHYFRGLTTECVQTSHDRASIKSAIISNNIIDLAAYALKVRSIKGKTGKSGKKVERLMHESEQNFKQPVRPFAPNLTDEQIAAIRARGKEKPWKKRGVARGEITAEEYFRKTYAEWLDEGVAIPPALVKKADQLLYNRMLQQLGNTSNFPAPTVKREQLKLG